MLSRTVLRQAARPIAASRIAVRHSSGAMPAGYGVAKIDNLESKVKEVVDKVKKENLSGEAFDARVHQLLADNNLTMYQANYEKGKEYMTEYEHVKEHGGSTADLWKKISLYVFIPALVLAGVNSYYVESEHAAHREHLAHHPEDRPVQYSYNKLVTKDFFWGNGEESMFWNPRSNFHKNE